MRAILLFMAVVFAGFANTATAQTPPGIPATVTLKPVHATVWWDPTNGSDANDGLTKAMAKKTWAAVRDACLWWDPLTEQAQIEANGTAKHTKVILVAGVHFLSAGQQVYQHYGLGTPSGSVPPFPDNYGGGNGNYRRHLGGSYSNPANWRPDLTKEISLVGENPDATQNVLDATNLFANPSSGSAVIRLAGRGISIENLTVRNSPNSRGIDFRTDESYNSVAGARQNNVLVRNVIVHNVGYFGIHILDTDGAVVENCVIYNAVMDNVNGQRHAAGGRFVSALKTSYTTNVAFINNKLYNNWGEGLNFCKMEGGIAIGNEVHNNYSVNLYVDNAKNIVLRNNRAWQLSDRTYWRMHTNQPTVKRAAPNLSISNERYDPETNGSNPRGEVERDAENIYAYNNVFHGSNITFGFSDRPTSRTNNYSNIYIVNNTAIDINADADVPLPLLNFVAPAAAHLANSSYTNIHISNNIFSITASKLNGTTVELARTSTDADPYDKLKLGLTTANNYWSENPYKSSRQNFIAPNDIKFNAGLPGSITDMSTLANIIPDNNPQLKFARAHESFMGDDILGVTRRLSPESNVGAIENTGALPVRFGSITAKLINGRLVVSWITASEEGNDHFDVEGSTDGINFTTIGTLKSRSLDGNSDSILQYEFTRDMPAGTLALSMGLLALGGLGLCTGRRRRVHFALMALLGLSVFYTGCKKTDSLSVNGDKLYIRIAQVDIDGSKTYSKIVTVIQE